MSGTFLRHYSSRRTLFLCCDLQERFSTLLPRFDQCARVANRFALAAAPGAIPNTQFVVTEQYPERLGKTVSAIALPPNTPVIPKFEFSMYDSCKPHIKEFDQVVIFGIEAHVCVLQTVGDLLSNGDADKTKVVVATDGIASTHQHDFEGAMHTYAGYQAVYPGQFQMMSSESILFQLVRSAKDPAFKAMSNIIKNTPIALPPSSS